MNKNQNDRNLLVWLGVAASLLVGTGCASRTGETALKPFTTDDCTLFPEGPPSDKTKWQGCCLEHDFAYWKGGTRREREAADVRMRQCFQEKMGLNSVPALVFHGVRAWGSPGFPTPYRWGYGWPYGRGYRKLTDDELRQVRDMLAEQGLEKPLDRSD